jgi:hypothetical protein
MSEKADSRYDSGDQSMLNEKFENLVEYVCGSLLIILAIVLSFGVLMLGIVTFVKLWRWL